MVRKANPSSSKCCLEQFVDYMACAAEEQMTELG